MSRLVDLGCIPIEKLLTPRLVGGVKCGSGDIQITRSGQVTLGSLRMKY